jgi:hypothetical protein
MHGPTGIFWTNLTPLSLKSMGLDARDVEVFVEAYQGDENGHPAPDKMGPGCSHPVAATGVRAAEDADAHTNATAGDASDWYWAIKHAGSDAWGTCPARRIANWYREIGQEAYWCAMGRGCASL